MWINLAMLLAGVLLLGIASSKFSARLGRAGPESV